MNSTHQTVQALLVFAIPVLFAISLHEVGHGYVARYFGDPTAANEGRLSINPLRHIDPFGTVVLPLVLYWLIQLPFGYAKPVPVEFDRLRNPKKHMAFVALAGPAANFAMGVAWSIIGILLAVAGIGERFWFDMVRAGVSVNAVMMVFNLLPIPPLDGSHVLASVLPERVLRWLPTVPPDGGRSLASLLPSGMLAALPKRTFKLVNDIAVIDVLIFASFILLMRLHVLDSFLSRAMTIAIAAFAKVASPFYFLLS
ncbi:site-2 protease family protein [Massilia sp. CCM 9210]|uniref:site-2 protease family protein n=1 Tax=Massilia scottii TaxID=3057166 RepID=UPI00279699FA|nr:site-2 protease family protein [Massilia sp. CCM 9210]MDQ1816237.1 site-2 protease family protein [Massilia sp. CCM 9210]